MTDYLWNFPRTSLSKALTGLTALRVELDLPPGTLPGNALGDPRDATGAMVTQAQRAAKPASNPVIWIGRPGSAATSFTDPAGKTVTVPAKGDPTKFYMHIRTDKTVQKFDPTQYGLAPTDPAESTAVLGVWAGDTP
jgi:hypothetical protein